jgi:ribonuclease D
LKTRLQNFKIVSVIDNDLKLAGVAERVRSAPWVAIDTEADSLHAYPEKICLIQITTLGGDELIDPLAEINLRPFLEILSTHELIMHGADYDLRLFRKHYDFVPRVIFDTMLASRLLGITQFGLTHLVAQFLGVTLDKGPQKADWAQRPLTERMENYARHDTHYLKALSDILKTELAAKGRLGWQQESCARLITDCAEIRLPDPDVVWRIKGSHVLSPAGLAILREIWQWREFEATAANKPPYFILRHESLIEISAAATENRPIAPLVPPKYSDRRRQGLADAIKKGLAVPPEEQPRPIRHAFRRVSDSVKRRMTELQQRRDDRAKELGIDPTLIASRAVLLDLAEDWGKHESELMNWQRELLQPVT